MNTLSALIHRLVQRHRFAFFQICVTGLLAAIPATPGFSQTANSQSSQQGRTISYVRPDGAIRTMLANADADEDGVSNELEIDGYYYCRREGVMHAAAQPCDGVLPDVTYKTDPDRWSSDGDPYSDFTEVSGVNMHPAVTVPENHPLVAASPVIVVQMPTYTIIPNGEITDTDGGSRSDAMTQEASVGVEVGYSETVGAEVGTGGMNASASATLSMSLSASFTLGSSVTNEVNWSRARSVNPSEAAFLSLGVFFENRGSAPILDLQTQFNLVLGDKVIATVTPDLTVNSLAPGERFPDASAPHVVIERDISNNPIVLTLEELKLVQLGAPLSLVVTQVDGKIGRWNSDTQSFDNDVDWSSWKANIEPVVVNLHADLGDGETHLYKIYAGTAVYDPDLTFRDVISLVFDVQENSGQVTIEGRPYPGNWFLTSPSQAVQDEWNAQGRPQNLLDLPMHRETIISMKSPGSQPGARINLATFTPDFRHVLVNATPHAFPILSVRAEVTVDGEAQSVTLVQDGAFYKNTEPFAVPADVNGKVFVKNAKGDISAANTVLPAFYSSAQDVIDYSNFLPVPGGDEYLLFIGGGDTTKPAVIYCDFFFEDGGPDIAGKEYLTLTTTDSTNFSEHPERFFFEKIRLDVNSLVVDPFDITFSNATGTGHGFGYSTQSCSEQSGNIDLRGTAFHLDPSAQFEATGPVYVDSLRKLIDFGGGTTNSCTVAGVRGQLKLAYDDFAELTLEPSLTTGRSLLFTGMDGAAPAGYVNMGAQTSLELNNTLTIETWLKPTGPKGGGLFLNKEGEYELARSQDGTIWWALANSSPGWVFIPTYYRAVENEWVHVALTYDGATIKTYINGNLFHSAAGSGPIGDHPTHANQDEFRIGSRQAANSHFAGFVDEVRVWNIVRTQQEIQKTAGTTLGPEVYESATSGLIGYWRFDELEDLGVGGDGANDVRDYSLNQNHGDIVGTVTISGIVTAVDKEDNDGAVPGQFTLQQNYPNPFNPATTISYSLPKDSHVKMTIFDILGREVAVLVDEVKPAGSHHLRFDAHQMPSGLYFYRVAAGAFRETRRMLLVK